MLRLTAIIFLLMLHWGMALAGPSVVSRTDVLRGTISSDYLEDKARAQTIKTAALESGVIWGRADAWKRINEHFAPVARELDKLNFNYLAIGPNILPPIYVEASDAVEQQSGRKLHLVKHIYRKIAPARIVAQIPTWRDYVVIEDRDDLFDGLAGNAVELKNKAEKDLWEKYAARGIAAGEHQAQVEFEYAISRLKRDYKGMLLAHYLHKLGMIDLSSYQVVDSGVLVTHNAANVKDTVVILTGDDGFLPHDQWQPFIRKEISTPTSARGVYPADRIKVIERKRPAVSSPNPLIISDDVEIDRE